MMLCNFGDRPIYAPWALGHARPSPVRARINSRSNSANLPSTAIINRLVGADVSAHVWTRDRKPAFLSVIVPNISKRPRVGCAKRSGHVTIGSSTAFNAASAFGKAGAVGLVSIGCFPEHLVATRFGQLQHPGVDALGVHRNPV